MLTNITDGEDEQLLNLRAKMREERRLLRSRVIQEIKTALCVGPLKEIEARIENAADQILNTVAAEGPFIILGLTAVQIQMLKLHYETQSGKKAMDI